LGGGGAGLRSRSEVGVGEPESLVGRQAKVRVGRRGGLPNEDVWRVGCDPVWLGGSGIGGGCWDEVSAVVALCLREWCARGELF